MVRLNVATGNPQGYAGYKRAAYNAGVKRAFQELAYTPSNRRVRTDVEDPTTGKYHQYQVKAYDAGIRGAVRPWNAGPLFYIPFGLSPYFMQGLCDETVEIMKVLTIA